MMIDIDGPRSNLPEGWIYGAHWSNQPMGQSGWWLLHESGASVRGRDVGATAADERVASELAAYLELPGEGTAAAPVGRPGPRGAAAWPKVTIRLEPGVYAQLQALAEGSVSALVAEVVAAHVRASTVVSRAVSQSTKL